MGFFAAVTSCIRNYAGFRGRASRAEYWWWTLFVILVEAATSGLGDAVGGLVGAALVLPSIAVGVRRLHDTGRSGWWMLIAFVPFIGFIVLLVFFVLDSQPGSNEYGPNPKGM